MPVKELAEKTGIIPQTLSNKLHRNVFTYQEFVQITDILGCDVKIIMRDTGKEFWDNITQQENRPKPKKKQAKLTPAEPKIPDPAVKSEEKQAKPEIPAVPKVPEPVIRTRKSMPAVETPQKPEEKVEIELTEEQEEECRRVAALLSKRK
jgi:hypothetical protein